ncbi:NAD(P)/FAD-dependent oxidoreductase [Echinicola sediminis]
MKEKEFVIIGAGQCGLSAGRHLQKAGKEFIILDQYPEVGDGWRRHFESLRLFTPAAYCSLPDLPLALAPKTRPTKDQIADYFSRYATHFELPVHNKNKVSQIIKEGDSFRIKSTFEEVIAQKIIIANGFCQLPVIPPWAETLSIPHIHSHHYRNPISIKGKKVLVVGTGNTAAQIIAELTTYFEVHWSQEQKPRYKSLNLFGKNILWWNQKFNQLDKPVSKKDIGKNSPIYLYNNLKSKIKKAKRHPQVTTSNGYQVTFDDGKTMSFDFILFATGYQPDFGFIQIDGFENNQEQLRAQQGISAVKGLFFLGIPYQRTRSSHLIYGAQKDAEFIVSKAMAKEAG